jgi:hypothetical protein
MATTIENAPAYLVVARYNRSKWRQLDVSDYNEREEAEEVAEELFPEEPNSKPLEDLKERGILLARTFASELFEEIDTPLYQSMSNEQKNLYLNGIYASRTLDVPVGWMTVVDANAFFSFTEWLNSEKGVFWRVFDIEISPLKAGWTELSIAGRVPALRNDTTTNEFYMFMTPRSWD